MCADITPAKQDDANMSGRECVEVAEAVIAAQTKMQRLCHLFGSYV